MSDLLREFCPVGNIFHFFNFTTSRTDSECSKSSALYTKFPEKQDITDTCTLSAVHCYFACTVLERSEEMARLDQADRKATVIKIPLFRTSVSRKASQKSQHVKP